MKAPAYNKPCPCGSGFKYKHCCLRTNKVPSQNFIDSGCFVPIDASILPKGLSKHDECIAINRLQMSQIPYVFQSIGFLHSKHANTQMFGVLSVNRVSLSETPEVLFKLHGVPVEVNERVRDEMFEYYLPRTHSGVPNGGAYINGVFFEVYFLTFKQSYECLRMIDCHTRYTLSPEDFKSIESYQRSMFYQTLEVYELMNVYKEHLRNLFDCFKDALHQANNIALRQQITKSRNTAQAAISERNVAQQRIVEQSITIAELQEENRKLRQALEVAKGDPDFSEIERQVTDECRDRYIFLDPAALQSLIEGELIYHTLKNSDACLDSIVASYGKTVEAQLKKHLRNHCPEAVYEGITLGAIIYAIRDYRVAPYHKSIDVYQDINDKRVRAAHPQKHPEHKITRKVVEELRVLLFDKKVLEQLR